LTTITNGGRGISGSPSPATRRRSARGSSGWRRGFAEMIAAAVAGFLLGGSLIVAIGAQNAFVLRQGLRRRHVFAVDASCAVSDPALIAAGVGGLGSLIAAQPSLLVGARVGGALFLFAYGCRSFLRAARPGQLVAGGGGGDETLGPAVAACLAFTFLNPHVYL